MKEEALCLEKNESVSSDFKGNGLDWQVLILVSLESLQVCDVKIPVTESKFDSTTLFYLAWSVSPSIGCSFTSSDFRHL